MKKLLLGLSLLLLFFFWRGCTTYECFDDIDGEFRFGFFNRPDYTNVYCGNLAVIPSGCDEAKWGGDIIVARGLRANHPYSWSSAARGVPGPTLYFIIHKTAYRVNPAAQELSAGFTGPLSQKEFARQDPLPNQPFQTVSQSWW